MGIRNTGGFLVIWSSLVIGLFLSIVKMPVAFDFLVPNYVVCALLYWVIAIPEKVNVGTGWLTGLFLDILLGSTLGVHATALAFMSWIVASQFKEIRFYSILQKTIVVGTVNFLGQFILFWTEHIFGIVTVDYDICWSGISTFLIWPVIYGILTIIYGVVVPQKKIEDE